MLRALALLGFVACAAGSPFTSMSAWAARNPIQTTAIAAASRGAIGDLAAQRLEQVSQETWKLDRQRVMLYTSFTLLVSFVYDRPIYINLLPRLFPSVVGGRRSWSNIVKATLADNIIASPLIYFPMFYIFKDCVIERSRSGIGALRHCAEELPSQLLPCWAFWGPCTAVSVGFVPVHLRIPFFSVAAIGWIGLLSARTSRLDAGARIITN